MATIADIMNFVCSLSFVTWVPINGKIKMYHKDLSYNLKPCYFNAPFQFCYYSFALIERKKHATERRQLRWFLGMTFLVAGRRESVIATIRYIMLKHFRVLRASSLPRWGHEFAPQYFSIMSKRNSSNFIWSIGLDVTSAVGLPFQPHATLGYCWEYNMKQSERHFWQRHDFRSSLSSGLVGHCSW